MNFKILIVDDVKIIRRSIQMMLNRDEYTIFLAESGAIALKLINQQKPDLILLDINLKDMDGINVLKKVKQELLF